MVLVVGQQTIKAEAVRRMKVVSTHQAVTTLVTREADRTEAMREGGNGGHTEVTAILDRASMEMSAEVQATVEQENKERGRRQCMGIVPVAK
jgi:hypothetical protein